MGGGSTSFSFDVGRPPDIAPIVSEIGLEIYSGPTASLAGSLPCWSAWFAPGVSYQLGSIVHFRGGSEVYQHKESSGVITSREYNGFTDPDEIASYEKVQGALIVDRSLIDFAGSSGTRYGESGAIGDDLSNILGYFAYTADSLFVCTKAGASLTTQQMDDPTTRKNLGFHSFQELENDGWTTGFDNSITADGVGGGGVGAFEVQAEYDEIILNLADLTASYVTEAAMPSGYGKPKIIKCKATMRPSSNSTIDIFSKVDSGRTFGQLNQNENYNLGPAEFALIPSDQISFGGGLVRTPNSQLEEQASRSKNPGVPASFDTEKHVMLEGTGSDYIDSQQPGDPYHQLASHSFSSPTDPRFGRASTSLNAFLGAVYKNSYPMSEDTTIPYWASDIDYSEGQVVRYALTEADSLVQPVDRIQKDFMWISKQTHTSNNQNRPPFSDQGNSNDYWQPNTRLINTPNSSLKDLHGLYKTSGAVLPYGISSGAGSVGLSQSSGSTNSEGRKRMSDIIGGSRLYGHLTLCPMGGLTILTTAVGYGCGRRNRDTCFRKGYTRYLPPAGADYQRQSSSLMANSKNVANISGTETSAGKRDGWDYKYLACMDLWLFPNNFKKDHAGQIKYAISFFDHVDYNIATSFGGTIKHRGFFARLFSILLGRRGRGANWTRVEKFSRSHFQTLTKDLDGFQAGQDPLLSKDISKSGTNTPQTSQDTDSESDIIRFSFRYLTAFHSSKAAPGGSNTVGATEAIDFDGYYEITIQDLNSGTMLRPSVRYSDLANPGAASNEQDSYGKTWNPTKRSTYDYSLWYEYNIEADKVASKFNWANLPTGELETVYKTRENTATNNVTNSSLKLLTTRNWYNWLILGPLLASPDTSNPENNYEPLIMRSMDVNEFTFDNLCGTVHTGFRSIDFDQIRNINTAGIDEIDFVFPDKLEEAASAAILPPAIDQYSGGSGDFNVSRGINKMPESFVSFLKLGSLDWDANVEYKAGQVVKKGENYFYIQENIKGSEIV